MLQAVIFSMKVRLSLAPSHSAFLKTGEVTVGPTTLWVAISSSFRTPQKSSSCSPSCSLHPLLPPPSSTHSLTCPHRLQRSSGLHPSVLPLPSSTAFGELRRGGAPPWRPWQRRRLVDLHRSPTPVSSSALRGAKRRTAASGGAHGAGGRRRSAIRARARASGWGPTPPPRMPSRAKSAAPKPSSTSRPPLKPSWHRWPRSDAEEGVFMEDEELGCVSCSCSALQTSSPSRRASETPDPRARPARSSGSRACRGAPYAVWLWTPAAAATPRPRTSGCEVVTSSSSCESRIYASRA
jgi:hypothetical protein